MIREEDVREAIAEMQGQRNPNANTCIKLAAYYTILDHLNEREPVNYDQSVSGAEGPYTVDYGGDSDFARAINGRDPSEIWPVIDELLTAVQVYTPRLYDGFMRRLGA